MPSLRDIKQRINSVTSTQKITSAMKMVAGSKLKKAETAAHDGRPYAQRMERMLGALIAGMPNVEMAPKLLAGTGRDDVHLLFSAHGAVGLWLWVLLLAIAWIYASAGTLDFVAGGVLLVEATKRHEVPLGGLRERTRKPLRVLDGLGAPVPNPA